MPPMPASPDLDALERAASDVPTVIEHNATVYVDTPMHVTPYLEPIAPNPLARQRIARAVATVLNATPVLIARCRELEAVAEAALLVISTDARRGEDSDPDAAHMVEVAADAAMGALGRALGALARPAPAPGEEG